MLASSHEEEHRWCTAGIGDRTWWLGLCLVVGFCQGALAQSVAKKSDADLMREGALALAAAHGEKPRYGGKFLSAGNEEIPFYDLHQTSLGGIYAAVAPAYNCLIRTSPYDPMAMDIIPELAHSWDISDGGKTITFHLHKGVKWHDGMPFSSADVKYTIERIMNPPKGMVSPRGPVFAALIERVEAPDPDTVVVHGKGPSGLLLPLFANGWNVIIPKHIAEKDPVNALKTTVIGTGPFRLKEPPTSSLWKYERNPEYFQKDLPFLDELEIHIITDPQALVAAILSKRVFWSDAFPHPNMDRDLSESVAKQNANLIRSSSPYPGRPTPHASKPRKPPSMTCGCARPSAKRCRVKRLGVGDAIRRRGHRELSFRPLGASPRTCATTDRLRAGHGQTHRPCQGTPGLVRKGQGENRLE